MFGPDNPFRVKVFSHGVVVTGFDNRGRRLLDEFTITRLGSWNVFKKWDGTWERKLNKVYAAATRNRQEYRFHINSWPALNDFLLTKGVKPEHIIVETVPLYEPAKCELTIKDGKALLDYQPPISDYIVAPGKSKLVILQTGKGKAQPLDSLIKIPHGWKRMGDIKVGDTITAKDGSPTKVTAVYPQGLKQIYRVFFYDGRYVECCAEHLWRVYRPNKALDWKVVNTQEMIRYLSLSNNRLYVELCESEQCDDVDLPLDPYLLGVLLGDGMISGSCVGFSTPDREIVEAFERALPEKHHIRESTSSKYDFYITRRRERIQNHFGTVIKNLGLKGTVSYNKFIPDIYMQGSTRQRLALLQGLMDTDGTVCKGGGTPSFSSSSKKLSEQVRELVWSLGGMATTWTKMPRYTYKGEVRKGAPNYVITIRIKQPSRLFRLKRKKMLTNDNNQYAATLKMRVDRILPVGEKEAQCISIDHPDRLYVTDGHVVTHNTFVSLHALTRIGERVLIVLKPMYFERWLDELRDTKKNKSTMGLEPGELLVVQGSADLRRCLDLALAGQLTAKIIVISNKTMYNYIDSYSTLNSVDGLYSVPPGEMYQTLKIGVRLIDEYHQDFHLNFIMDLYTHCPKTISLSATMVSDNAFINKMYAVAVPPPERFAGLAYDKYIVATALYYQLKPNTRISWTRRGRSSYSHTALEESLLRNKQALTAYTDMIGDLVQQFYINVVQPGQRMLIFAATIEYCTYLTEALKKRFMGIEIKRYVGEDSYEDLLTADIAVSTLQSAGTAVDIAGLRITLMTTALQSQQGNEQALGRLRKLRMWPDIAPEFYYLVCRDIDAHMRYDETKKKIFLDKVLSFKEIELSHKI